jgi:hypothetical protein
MRSPALFVAAFFNRAAFLIATLMTAAPAIAQQNAAEVKAAIVVVPSFVIFGRETEACPRTESWFSAQ